MKPAYTLFLKTGTWCNAGCITCPAGRKRETDKENSSNMTTEMLERILDYVLQQGKIVSASHHFYNEPTALPNIAELVKACHDRGVYCFMSTNGSMIKGLRNVLNQGLTNLIMSISGFTNETHQRSHHGIDIEQVKRNMIEVSKIIHSRKDFSGGRMFVRVSWHDYLYNEHEKPLMKKLCDDLGFHFTPYNTGLLPLEQAQARMLEAAMNPSSPEHPGERDLRTKLAEAHELCGQRKHWTCINQGRMLTIDGDGNLHNCCVKAHDANKRGSLFDTNLEEFNTYRKTKDEDCAKCIKHGHHVYAMQQYRLPLGIKTTVKKAGEDLWRKYNLGGVFPKLSALRSQMSYDRPIK
jgi:MoaA/NifB/PqqE/SkfB family radical SAM enzyme